MRFETFCEQVRALLDIDAEAKGYNQSGSNGPNQLYEFVRDTVGGNGHALGECIYKLRRYATTGNPQDVLKCAAWCYLILKHAQPDGE